MTPLMWSAYHNNAAITSFLLHKGADCEEKDIDGYTAMHWYVINCVWYDLARESTVLIL